MLRNPNIPQQSIQLVFMKSDIAYRITHLQVHNWHGVTNFFILTTEGFRFRVLKLSHSTTEWSSCSRSYTNTHRYTTCSKRFSLKTHGALHVSVRRVKESKRNRKKPFQHWLHTSPGAMPWWASSCQLQWGHKTEDVDNPLVQSAEQMLLYISCPSFSSSFLSSLLPKPKPWNMVPKTETWKQNFYEPLHTNYMQTIMTSCQSSIQHHRQHACTSYQIL